MTKTEKKQPSGKALNAAADRLETAASYVVVDLSLAGDKPRGSERGDWIDKARKRWPELADAVAEVFGLLFPPPATPCVYKVPAEPRTERLIREREAARKAEPEAELVATDSEVFRANRRQAKRDRVAETLNAHVAAIRDALKAGVDVTDIVRVAHEAVSDDQEERGTTTRRADDG